jgi:CDGSH-type Zn-finger protein
MEGPNRPRIRILPNGPYLVTGRVPLTEKIITPNGNGYLLEPGRLLPRTEVYSLCRCGRSKTPPFCDGSHLSNGFSGKETASRRSFEDRAEIAYGPELDLLDDNRCAFARFCHREDGDVWELVEHSDDPHLRQEAIVGSNECPSGRLVAVEKDGRRIEPVLEPAIEVAQDPENECSASLFVKGKIPVVSSDGTTYEIRNRVALCRCGKSKNKPFCDMTHVTSGFDDGHSDGRA